MPSKKIQRPKKKVQVWIHTDAQGGKRRYLILKMRPDRGGFWQPVTGGVELGEELLAAAARESDEETALPFRDSPVAVGHEFAFRRRGALILETVFRREIAADAMRAVRIDPDEHVAFEWVDRAEAYDRIEFDSNRDALKAVLASLGEN